MYSMARKYGTKLQVCGTKFMARNFVPVARNQNVSGVCGMKFCARGTKLLVRGTNLKRVTKRANCSLCAVYALEIVVLSFLNAAWPCWPLLLFPIDILAAIPAALILTPDGPLLANRPRRATETCLSDT